MAKKLQTSSGEFLEYLCCYYLFKKRSVRCSKRASSADSEVSRNTARNLIFVEGKALENLPCGLTTFTDPNKPSRKSMINITSLSQKIAALAWHPWLI